MRKKVLVHKIAAKYLERLDVPTRSRIKEALDGLSENPPAGDIVPISGQPGLFRLVIGGYRALFKIDVDVVRVTHLDPRGQVYKKKNKGR